MTLEHKLRKLLDSYGNLTACADVVDREILKDLEALLQNDPVKIERERCAQIADQFRDKYELDKEILWRAATLLIRQHGMENV